jgi:hypothetical protein
VSQTLRVGLQKSFRNPLKISFSNNLLAYSITVKVMLFWAAWYKDKRIETGKNEKPSPFSNRFIE